MTAYPAATGRGARARVFAATRFLILLCLLPLLPGLCGAVSAPTRVPPALVATDRHYGPAIDRQLWNDPWAHGFQHGYEDGFHLGEWDHQTLHQPTPPRKRSDWKHADRGYLPAMGNPKAFKKGYRRGFANGYIDACGGKPFDALAEIAALDPAFSCPPRQCAATLEAEARRLRGVQR